MHLISFQNIVYIYIGGLSLASSSGIGSEEEEEALVFLGQPCTIEYSTSDKRSDKKTDWVCEKVCRITTIYHVFTSSVFTVIPFVGQNARILNVKTNGQTSR